MLTEVEHSIATKICATFVLLVGLGLGFRNTISVVRNLLCKAEIRVCVAAMCARTIDDAAAVVTARQVA